MISAMQKNTDGIIESVNCRTDFVKFINILLKADTSGLVPMNIKPQIRVGKFLTEKSQTDFTEPYSLEWCHVCLNWISPSGLLCVLTAVCCSLLFTDDHLHTPNTPLPEAHE